MVNQGNGAWAAFATAAVAVATLFVGVVLIGPAAASDPNVFVQMALHNPTPLLLQDGLKFVSAGVALALIAALHARLAGGNVVLARWARAFGYVGVVCLIVNMIFSIVATTQAGTFAAQGNGQIGLALNGAIILLGLASVFFNGLWYLLISRVALKDARWPKALAYLGIVMGVLSLLPILGLIVLVLSIPWAVWVGLTLRAG